MKTTKLKIASSLFLSGALMLSSCKKNEQVIDDQVINNPGGGISKGAKITSSVGGVVIDENENPVSGAQVSLGTTVAITDLNGAFLFRDVEVGDRRDYLVVNKNGFFHGSRAFDAEEGTVTQVKVKLLSNSTTGSFSSASGGSVSSNGVTLNFPADAVEIDGGGAYSGTVNVALKFLDPTNDDIDEVMPGDLLALNQNGDERILETFGMAAVELRSPSGQKLNVASGKTVELKVPLSGAYLSEAPASIPLWYFDEVNGNWVEEGSATLVGSEYVGEVSHFTFWNCDNPNPNTSIEGRIVCRTTSGYGVAGVKVSIKNPSGRILGTATTDNTGRFSGFIPQNTLLTIIVKDACGAVIYTGNIGPFSSAPVTLADIDACPVSGSGLLTGKLLDCSNNPITNGAVFVDLGGSNSVILYPDATGNVNATLSYCSATNVTVTGYDYANAKQSAPASVPVSATMNFGNLTVCNSVDEYLNYTLDGVNFSILGVPGSYLDLYNATTSTYIYASEQGTSNYVNFSVGGSGVGTFPVTDTLGVNNYWGNSTGNNITVNFTTYGSGTGTYVEGNFNGTFVDQSTITRTLSGNFRIKQ